MNCLFILSATALLLAFVSAVQRKAGEDVIGIEDAPYTVSIQRKDPEKYCGGALISNQYVLTAAHCGASPEYSKVSLGSNAKHEGGTLVTVASYIQHPKYHEGDGLHNDLAIIRLETPVAFSKQIEPIKMVAEGDETEVGTMTKISGWTEAGEMSSEFLRAVNVPVISLQTCRANHGDHFGEDFDITDRMICAKGEKDACHGFSGEPLKRMTDGLLIGIGSWGDLCNTSNHPSVYTKISLYRNWIKNVTGI